MGKVDGDILQRTVGSLLWPDTSLWPHISARGGSNVVMEGSSCPPELVNSTMVVMSSSDGVGGIDGEGS